MGMRKSSYDEKVEEITELLVEHYDLETLHHYDFYLSDFEDGIAKFIDRNLVNVVAMLQEGGHLG